MADDPILRLPEEWYNYVVAAGADPGKPGIYEWHIEGVGRYIGKYKHLSRPRSEYGINVVRILNGKPYRKTKPDKFRRIHRELASAIRAGLRPTLTILENPPPHEINSRERLLIGERGTLNGSGQSSKNLAP